MIAFLAIAAQAGLLDDNPKNDCRASASYPIVGTAGFANTLQAFRTNAATYSASAYVERHALRRIALTDSPEKQVGIAVLDANFVYGVTKVPVFQEDVSADGCPSDFLISARAVDMYSYNGGGAYRVGRFGVFYAAAATFSYPAELTYLRAYQSVGSIYLGPAFLASAMFGSLETAAGASAYAQDAIVGAVFDAEIADLRAGYTKSRGWYASVQDHYLGLFGSIVLRDGLHLVGQFRGGAERVKPPGNVSETVGATSVFARILPLSESTDGEADQIDLKTGHLEQEGIAGMIDLRAAYAIEPVAQLHEASIAIHDREFYTWEDGGTSELVRHFYLEAGFVRLPPLYYYGVEGGMKLHLRGEVVFTPKKDVDGGKIQGSFGLLLNDPEQTALYPFAVDAVSGKASLKGSF